MNVLPPIVRERVKLLELLMLLFSRGQRGEEQAEFIDIDLDIYNRGIRFQLFALQFRPEILLSLLSRRLGEI